MFPDRSRRTDLTQVSAVLLHRASRSDSKCCERQGTNTETESWDLGYILLFLPTVGQFSFSFEEKILKRGHLGVSVTSVEGSGLDLERDFSCQAQQFVFGPDAPRRLFAESTSHVEKSSSPASAHGQNDFGPSWSERVQSLPHSEGHKSPKWQNPENDLQGISVAVDDATEGKSDNDTFFMVLFFQLFLVKVPVHSGCWGCKVRERCPPCELSLCVDRLGCSPKVLLMEAGTTRRCR